MVAFLVFIFCFASPFYRFSSLRSQEPLKFQVALLKVRDFSGSGMQGLDEKVMSTLRLQLQQTPYFETKNPELVETWLSKSKIVTADEETAQQVARGVGLDGVFIADILKVETNAKTKEVQMDIQLQLIDKNGGVISRSILSGSSGKKPGFSGDADILLQEAVHNTTLAAILDTQKNLTTKGIVTYIKGNGMVSVNLNASQGIKKGAEFTITRNGEVIAKCVVADVLKTSVLAQVRELGKDKFISPGDNVQLTYNPFSPRKTDMSAQKSSASKSGIKTLAAIVGTVGIVALLVSGKKSDKGQSSSGVAISVSASPGNIIADKKTTSTVTATLKDATTNVAVADGQTVSFKTTAGTLLSGSASTSGGEASVQLQSDDKPGTAVITAEYGNASSTTSILFTSLSVSLSSNATSIAANGTSTATITATVKDASNVPAPDGTVVTFSSTSGTIGGTATTKNGAATTTLTSATSPSKTTATVTAKAGGAEAAVNVDFVPVEPKVIFLSVNPASAPADGKTAATLTAIVKDENNNMVTDGTEVKFTTNLGTVTATAKTTSGQAQASITSTATGAATVIAQAGSVSTSTAVTFTSLSISITASPTSIPADGATTTALTISAKTASTGAALVNTQIKLTTSSGTFTSNGTQQVTKTTDGSGTVSETLKAGTTAGIVTVTASSGDTTSSTNITFVSGGVSSITISASPSSVTADGKSTTTITASVKDIYGNSVQDGTQIIFTISDPNAKISPSTASTLNGAATATLTSSLNPNKVTVKACYEIKAGLGCSQDPTTFLFPVSGEAYVTFTSGTPAFIIIGPNKGFANVHGWDIPNTEVKNTLMVYDSNHNFVSNGTVVNFTVDGGAIASQSTTTDGEINISFFTIGNFPKGEAGVMGWATLTAISGDAVGKTPVLISGSPNSITASAATVGSGADKYYKITVNVWDVNNNPVVAGFGVNFTTNLGSFSKNDAVFETAGGTAGDDEIFKNIATANLYPRGNIGTASVTITSGSASKTIQFNIAP